MIFNDEEHEGHEEEARNEDFSLWLSFVIFVSFVVELKRKHRLQTAHV